MCTVNVNFLHTRVIVTMNEIRRLDPYPCELKCYVPCRTPCRVENKYCLGYWPQFAVFRVAQLLSEDQIRRSSYFGQHCLLLLLLTRFKPSLRLEGMRNWYSAVKQPLIDIFSITRYASRDFFRLSRVACTNSLLDQPRDIWTQQ